MGRTAVIKSVHVRFPENIHRAAKMKAAALGRTLSDYLARLIMGDETAQDVVAKALAMPIMPDDEEMSEETLKAIEEAEKEENGGTWEELLAEAEKKRKKRHAR